MKDNIREEMLKKRGQLTEAEWEEKSQAIAKHVTDSEGWRKAKWLFVFVSMGKEVDTYGLIRQAWQEGKRVAVPIAKKKTGMYFVEITTLAELQKSKFGVMEPVVGMEYEVTPNAEDLFLVPGAVFDRKGNRYGYGGGYYDRYFSKHQGFVKRAVAFSFQMSEEELDVMEYDVPVDEIITEIGRVGGK